MAATAPAPAAAGPVWVFTGIGALLLAVVFANLGRALPRTGGPAQRGSQRLARREQWGGRGGPRCMSRPIERQELS